MSTEFYKPLTPAFRIQINDSISKNIAELKTCEQNVLVNMQIQGQLALKNLHKLYNLMSTDTGSEKQLACG